SCSRTTRGIRRPASCWPARPAPAWSITTGPNTRSRPPPPSPPVVRYSTTWSPWCATPPPLPPCRDVPAGPHLPGGDEPLLRYRRETRYQALDAYAALDGGERDVPAVLG